MTEQALSEVSVLDLTHYIAGPYCTRILAGFGADVIKFEKPDEGDGARKIGPFLNDEPGVERSGLFLYLNGNKKGITLNLKSPAGVKIFKELARDADVVVENFSPGVMQRLGLDYPTLKKINPRLVMTSISNFGQTGPYRDYKLAHLIAWGMAIGYYTGGGFGQPPLQIGGWITHHVTGLFATVGTATAVYNSLATGKGQYIDVSMMESNALISSQPATIHDYTGLVHFDIGGRGVGVYTCKDGGYIGPNAWTPPQVERMFTMLGVPELVGDPRFQTPYTMLEHRDALVAIISEKIKEYDTMELFQKAVEWNVPFAMVATTREVLDSPQHQARRFFEEVDHPVLGKVTMPGAPFKMMDTPWQQRNPAPLLGEHNEEVYCQRLGYTKEDLVRLKEQGVI